MILFGGDVSGNQPSPGVGTGTSVGSYLQNQILAEAMAATTQQQYGSTQEQLIRRYTGVGTVDTPRSVPGRSGVYRPATARLQTYKSATPEQYVQEFYDRWDDPRFQTWFMSRTLASGKTSAKSTYEDYLSAWVDIGKVVANGQFRGTPEQYLEWAATGQQVSVEDIQQEMEAGQPVIDPETDQPILPVEEQAGASGSTRTVPVNPITTYKSIHSATISREAAYAAADQLAQQLLGRMLTKAEMRKARRVMNGLLAENPTVTTTTRDATDPFNVVERSHTRDGMSAADAAAALEMRMQRSSEGTAFTVGNMFEDAMRLLGSKEG